MFQSLQNQSNYHKNTSKNILIEHLENFETTLENNGQPKVLRSGSVLSEKTLKINIKN